jgi:hypothetical protein
MSQVITVSESLYARLDAEARKRGLNSIAELLEQLPIGENELAYRQEAVRRIDALRERLFAAYGEMADSVE